MSTEIATKFKDTDIGLIPGDWDVVTIPKIAQNFDNKRKPLSSAEREKMKGIYPYYGAAGIIDWVNNFIFDGKYLLVAEDGTVTNEEGYPTLQLTDGKFWVSNHAHILQCEDFIETKFLYYALKNQNIRAFVTGAVQPKLNQENLNSIQFPYPTKKEERNNICEVLSSIDEKIAINNKINSNLEKLGSLLFKQWVIDGEQKIKDGCKIGKVSDLIRVESGFPFHSSMFDESGDYKLVTIKNVQDGFFVPECTDSLSEIPTKVPTHCRLNNGDILLSLTGNVGRVCFVYGENYLLNQRVANLVPIDENNRAFTYFLFRQKDFQNTLIGISRGTAQQNLSPIETKSLEITIPSQNTLDRFANVANPIFQKLVENYNEIKNLSLLRDSLLPRLMNGKIRVK